IAGEQVQLAQGSLFQNRDYPVLNEYRLVLGNLFGGIFGLNARQLDQIFSGVDFAKNKSSDLGLV
ncbi:MAG: DUF1501 domain-containing protein, partial [Undibacterium sp.]|nr:DUF1501 domain-containing protein [Undibacterium sp.]